MRQTMDYPCSSVNKQILEVILMPGNDAILMAYQINARYNTHACDDTRRHINYSLRFIKSIPINDSLKEAVKPYCT